MFQYRLATATCSRNIEIYVNKISLIDVWWALHLGWKDFIQQPSHYFFAMILYPFMGFVLYFWAAGENTIQLLFPMLTGFALLGPFVALFLYEISRRLEKGLDTSWVGVLSVRNSPAIPAILTLGLMLAGLFCAWMVSANILYTLLYGNEYPVSVFGFFWEVILTPRGWILITLGNGIGACFALFALCTTVVAFPLILEHEVSAVCGIRASLQAVKVNPVPLILWGAVICFGLFLGSIIVLVGLIIVLPVLGHATWHIYRKVLAFPERHSPT
jgi:uncharacterized membrane protein